MKQSDTNAIANLYVESINRGADPSKMSDQTYNKICTMVKKLKNQGVPLEDAKYRIADSLEYPENTDDLGHTIERVWGITDTIGDRKHRGENIGKEWGWGANAEFKPSDPDLAPSELRFRARASGKRGEYK